MDGLDRALVAMILTALVMVISAGVVVTIAVLQGGCGG